MTEQKGHGPLIGFFENENRETHRAATVSKHACRPIETYRSITRYSRIKLTDRTIYQDLPTNTGTGKSALVDNVLASLREKHLISVQEFRNTAVMMRCDWAAGTPQEALSDLMTRLQDQAGRKGTKIHFMIVAEHKEGQKGNHFHGVLWLDESKLNYPIMVNAMWRKIMKARNLPWAFRIIWRRNKDKPFRFQIGQSQEEFEHAFYVASYLAKTCQPPLKDPRHKARITSRVRNLEIFRPSSKTCFQLVLADELESTTRLAGQDALSSSDHPSISGMKIIYAHGMDCQTTSNNDPPSASNSDPLRACL
jgi:hypothetical protein